MTISRGTLLGGQYSVLDQIADNEYATVYKAVDVADDGKPVAIKTVSVSTADGVAEELFRREVDSLSRLRHPNVVRLLGSQHDPVHGSWLALEWMDGGSLAAPATRDRFGTIDAQLLTMRALLDGLAFAHLNHVLHRDIKPANILYSGDGTAKLADFNVSKVLRRATATRTVKHIFTLEYAALEQRSTGLATERSDIYSLGKVMSELVARVPSGQSDAEILRALEAAAVKGSLRLLLRRMMSEEPTSRPTATQALREVAALLATIRPMPVIAFKVAPRALERFGSLARRAMTDHEVRVAIETDLAGPLLVKVRPQPSDKGGRSYTLLGRRYSVHAVARDGGSGSHWAMVILGVSDRDAAWDERDRAAAVELPMTCRLLGDGTIADFAHDADTFVTIHRQHTQGQGAAASDAARQRWQVARWHDYVATVQEIAQRQGAIGLVRHSRERDHLFELTIERTAGADLNLVEARICVQTYANARPVPLGVVIEATASTIIVRPNDDFPERLTIAAGARILLDMQQQSAALRRQSQALNILETRADTNGDLLDLVVFPERVVEPKPVQFAPRTPDLDPQNRAVVAAALGTDRIFLVQGPPGTGKTTVIGELVAQILEREPGSRMLLVSQANVAIDNVLERLARLVESVPAVRLGSPERVAPRVQVLLLETRLRAETAAVRERASSARALLDALPGNREHLAALSELWDTASNRTADRAEVRRLAHELLGEAATGNDSQLDERIRAALDAARRPAEWQSRRRAVQEKWIERLNRSGELESILFANMRAIAGTCVGVIASPAVAREQFEWVIVDEAGRASAPELLVPLVRGKRIVLVGDHKQLPPILDRDALDEVFTKGDPARAEFEKSMFEGMFKGVSAGARLALTRQYRMHPTIAGLIETCFYPGGLGNGVTAEQRPFGVQLWGVPLRWLDTSALKGADEIRAGTSFCNPKEARIIARDLRRTLRAASEQGLDGLSVGVLTGYARQVEVLEEELTRPPHRHPGVRVEVLSVDAAQGKEFDLVYYSTVRANRNGKIGFLQDERRLNVALSRARHGLSIVGHLRCVRQADTRFGSNPFLAVDRYLRQPGDDRSILTLTRDAD